MTDPAAVLGLWGSFGAAFATRQRRRADWNCVGPLIDVAKEKLRAEAERLNAVLAMSDEALEPLLDPFRLDLGLHRWLAEDREEAYSDWLQWVVNVARTPAHVFRLFGQPCPADLSEADASTLDLKQAKVPC